jgi:hypothetical protein
MENSINAEIKIQNSLSLKKALIKKLYKTNQKWSTRLPTILPTIPAGITLNVPAVNKGFLCSLAASAASVYSPARRHLFCPTFFFFFFFFIFPLP